MRGNRQDSFEVTKDVRFLIPVTTQQAATPITGVVNWRRDRNEWVEIVAVSNFDFSADDSFGRR